MKKNYPFKFLLRVFLFILLVGASFLGTAQNNCPFHVRITTQDATCYNNGVVRFQLLDNGGLPTTATDAGLSECRCYYVEPVTSVKKYSEYNVDSLVVEYGTLTVGYEALCSDGNGGWVLLDTNTVVTVNTTYRTPTASALYAVANTDTDFGRWPTLSCKNTGRVQLKIEGGKFPYTVIRKAHDSDVPVQTYVFDNYQYVNPLSGDFLNETDLTRFDYKDYYTFDSLPAGNWDFYVVDGCGYGLPRTGQIVEVVEYPKLNAVKVLSANTTDSNVVCIQADFDKAYLQYQYQPQYRFHNGAFGTTNWYPIPTYEQATSLYLYLYDTVNTDNYCSIYDEDLSIEVGLAPCETTGPAQNFMITKPTYFSTDYSDINDSTYQDNENPCLDKKHYHTWYYSIGMNLGNLFNQHYFTTPLRWEWIDKSLNAVIKSDTLSSSYGVSKLYDTDIEDFYGPFNDSPRIINGRRQLVDAKGCILYYEDKVFNFHYDIGEEISDWRIDFSKAVDHCCTTQRWIKVYEHYTTSASKDGTIVRLVRSPYGNKYNFEAVYHEATHSWSITRSNLENMADIVCSSDGKEVAIYDYCLPTGPYHFEVVTACDSFALYRNHSFSDRYSLELTQRPSFSYVQKCTDMYVKALSGEISLYKRNTDYSTGEEKPVVIQPMDAYFKIVSGPLGGYDGSPFKVGDSVRISLPGQYVISFQMSDKSNSYCEQIEFFDTLVYNGSTLEFDYEYALLCDSTQHQGNVYVKGKNGTMPYTYVLYSGPDKTGSELARNNTGIFENINYNIDDVLSCYIEDDCGAYFYVNINPLSLAEAQKTWFDGGLKVTSTCEGSYISVHALSIENVFSYEWTGPNGFHSESSDPQIFVPRDAEPGKYYVALRNSGCSGDIIDSVTLNVIESPSLEISPDATVCPGEIVNVQITPHSANAASTVHYKVAIENAAGITYKEGFGLSGESQTIPVTVSSNTKVYATLIDDGTCQYTIADDTVYLNVRNDIANSCTMITSDAMVCYGSTAMVKAKSTMEPPYTLRWYSDYELGHLLQENVITTAAQWSYYYFTQLKHKAVVYVAVEKEGNCPTVYGLPTNTVNMTNGSATIHCGETYRVYDSGGPDGDYEPGESYKYYFTSGNGQPLSIKFNDFDLAEGAKLHVISGDQLSTDSVLYTLQKGSHLPEIIISKGDKLTLWFMSSMHPAASGWSANVENKPGIAIADVWPENHVYIYDNVCQNQSGNYDDPYHAKDWSSSIAIKISNDVKKAGVYTYDYHKPDIHGCDSITTLVLTVNPAPHTDTSVTITSLTGSYTWDKTGETYTESGLYSKIYTTDDGCDSLTLLYLTILDVYTFGNEMCVGDSTELGIMATAPDITWNNEFTSTSYAIGDILLEDGSIIKSDDYNSQIHSTPVGVVFYVDQSGQHGWAVSKYPYYPNWHDYVSIPQGVYDYIHSLHRVNSYMEALADTAGWANTMEIKRTANLAAQNASATWYCTMFDDINGRLQWYLPAYGQLNLLYANLINVEKTITKIGGYCISNYVTSPIYSSTEFVADGKFCGGYSSRSLNIAIDKYSVIRASGPGGVLAFPICNF